MKKRRPANKRGKICSRSRSLPGSRRGKASNLQFHLVMMSCAVQQQRVDCDCDDHRSARAERPLQVSPARAAITNWDAAFAKNDFAIAREPECSAKNEVASSLYIPSSFSPVACESISFFAEHSGSRAIAKSFLANAASSSWSRPFREH